MKIFIVIPFLIFFSAQLFAQNLNGRLSSSVYSFERFDTVGSSTNFTRGYQTMNLNFTEGDFSLRSAMNFEHSYTSDLDIDPRLRVYNLFLEARKVLDVMTLRIGRQTFFASSLSGLYDGASINVKYGNFTLSSYYGGNVPAFQKFELTDDFNTDYVYGAKVSSNIINNFDLSLSFVNKNFKPQEYFAVRLDENLFSDTILVKRKSNQFKYASGAITYSLPNQLRVTLAADYDINFKKTSKVEFDSRVDLTDDLGLNLFYFFREPRIRYNSYFAIFRVENSQEYGAGVDYKITDDIIAQGNYGYVKYKDDNSQRISVGLITDMVSASYSKNFGYAGELDDISVLCNYSFNDGFVTPSLGISYTNYKMDEDAPENKATTIIAGTNIRPWRMLSFDTQIHYVNNKIYNNDYRFFLKLNYWFNTNF
ncbi:MAG: hypothetical protein C0442_09920 [Chlorobiaceae bacterium]|nr:hypothetical protein [Chlorobiaceae bacterium]